MRYDCRTLAERDQGIAAAVEAVKSGQLVVLPTGTMYGVGANAFDADAVAGLRRLKGHGRDVASPVMVGSQQTLDGLVLSLPQAARELVEAFWPGELSIIVEHAPSLSWDIGDTDGTFLVRQPLHPVALELLRETGPMVVVGAALAGQTPPTTAEQAQEQLGSAVSVYLEAGPHGEPVPSTIVDCAEDPPLLLRPGTLTFETLRGVVPELSESS
ncbi:L-threonylcarbamoyladenylate synthase [Actinocatenispora rupis]|uniref:L-threonylcarbamoyladenylate synthase n=1 Tax=Actinocatenispora rupis TaxID=519421 RepID=A0A8J3J3D7_9ACTN|nr:L-threonylcarbamoyladenylate synthase [Actinocatenispora rupis]GID15086.1 putative threonylcarbamoyl-AMP synthase [Actinocatenispora rupis]